MTFLYVALILVALLSIHELIGKPIRFLRWSVTRLALGTKQLLRVWQVGDGHEEACARYVLAHAGSGSIPDLVLESTLI